MKKIILFFLFIFTAILIMASCASIYPPLTQPELTDQQVTEITEGLRTQEKTVRSFYSTGNVFVKDGKLESGANTLIVAQQDPLKIKIEITHSWGSPIIHILIDNEVIKVLNFQERRIYQGLFTNETLSNFISVNIDPRYLWSVIRGYPFLIKDYKTVKNIQNRIMLLDNQGNEIEVISFDKDNIHPDLVFFPQNDIQISFSGLRESNGIFYAWKVEVTSDNGKRNLILRNDKMVFNKYIPEKIFSINSPPMFELVELN